MPPSGKAAPPQPVPLGTLDPISAVSDLADCSSSEWLLLMQSWKSTTGSKPEDFEHAKDYIAAFRFWCMQNQAHFPAMLAVVRASMNYSDTNPLPPTPKHRKEKKKDEEHHTKHKHKSKKSHYKHEDEDEDEDIIPQDARRYSNSIPTPPNVSSIMSNTSTASNGMGQVTQPVYYAPPSPSPTPQRKWSFSLSSIMGSPRSQSNSKRMESPSSSLQNHRFSSPSLLSPTIPTNPIANYYNNSQGARQALHSSSLMRCLHAMQNSPSRINGNNHMFTVPPVAGTQPLTDLNTATQHPQPLPQQPLPQQQQHPQQQPQPPQQQQQQQQYQQQHCNQRILTSTMSHDGVSLSSNSPYRKPIQPSTATTTYDKRPPQCAPQHRNYMDTDLYSCNSDPSLHSVTRSTQHINNIGSNMSSSSNGRVRGLYMQPCNSNSCPPSIPSSSKSMNSMTKPSHPNQFNKNQDISNGILQLALGDVTKNNKNTHTPTWMHSDNGMEPWGKSRLKNRNNQEPRNWMSESPRSCYTPNSDNTENKIPLTKQAVTQSPRLSLYEKVAQWNATN